MSPFTCGLDALAGALIACLILWAIADLGKRAIFRLRRTERSNHATTRQ